MENQTTSSTLTFDTLLEKYAGNIKRATSEELSRVSPNGLKALFEANRRYRARFAEVPTPRFTFLKNVLGMITKRHLRKQAPVR